MCVTEVQENDFDKFSKNIVSNFIRTCISIDNEPVYDNAISEVKDPDASIRSMEESSIENEHQNGRSKSINIPELTKAFIDKQILYTGIKPEVSEDTPEQFVEKYYSIINKSDIIILDWELYNDDKDGKYTQALIKKIIEENNLKLVIIYSASDHYTDIIPEALIKLSGKCCNEETKSEFFGNGYSVCCKGIKIKFVHKNKEYIIDGVPNANIYDLPQLCIDEFTKLVNGLLANAVVSAITSIRNNTFNIISKFPTEFDANYINHRINLPVPEDAEDFIYQIISDEIKAAIDFDKINKCINIEAIKKIIDTSGYKKSVKVTDQQDSECDVKELAQIGRVAYKKRYNKSSKFDKYLDLTSKIINKDLTEEDINKTELNFSALSMTSPGYYSKDRLPHLSLGSIIALEEEQNLKCEGKDNCKISCHCNNTSKYYLCIQPRCDSVRLKNAEEPLLFFPLEDIDEKKSLIAVTFKDNADEDKTKVLGAKTLNKAVIKIFIKQDDSDRISAIYENARFIFKTKNGDKYRWVTELKFSYAQKFIEKLSRQISRVGIDEYEWFRQNYDRS